MKAETLFAIRLDGRCVDLTIEAGRVARATPSAAPPRALALPLLTDAHLHLDKTHVVDRIGGAPSGLAEAIALSASDRARWTDADLRRRIGRALTEAEAAGIGALRTHVDWSEPARPRAWDLLAEIADDWRGRIRIQRAALVPLDLLGEPGHGSEIAAQVAASGGALGAFVYRNDAIADKLGRVFALADRHGLALDFHVDEGLDPEARGFDVIVDLTRRLRLGGRVLCGHACSLAVRPEAEVAALLDRAAEAGVALAVLPTTNGHLQDARPGRTPRLRGLAPLQEARAAGVAVVLALDNVRDAFYPYGEYDLLDAWRLAVLNGHLAPEDWIDAITTTPAQVLGLPSPALREGARADFLLLETPDAAGIVSRARLRPAVWRDGRPLERRLEPVDA